MTDVIRIAHLRIAHQAANTEAGIHWILSPVQKKNSRKRYVHSQQTRYTGHFGHLKQLRSFPWKHSSVSSISRGVMLSLELCKSIKTCNDADGDNDDLDGNSNVDDDEDDLVQRGLSGGREQSWRSGRSRADDRITLKYHHHQHQHQHQHLDRIPYN